MLSRCTLVLIVAATCQALEEAPSHAFVISLNKVDGNVLAERVRTHLLVQNVEVIIANNGTGAVLPLYTRHLIRHGRNEHMQIGNRAMVGCLLSHAEAWKRVSTWTYVFEEDALIEAGIAQKVSQLLKEVRWLDFSVLMLQGRRFEAGGSVREVGSLAATCDECTWFGTRGYIVTKEGAGILLEYVNPAVVQVDALMGLVNEFDSRFHLLWTLQEIVGNSRPLVSTVWDGCVLACFSVQIACALVVVTHCALLRCKL